MLATLLIDCYNRQSWCNLCEISIILTASCIDIESKQIGDSNTIEAKGTVYIYTFVCFIIFYLIL